MLEDIGCTVVELDAERHDRAMAHTHALAFFVAKGLVGIGTEADAELAPPSFQAMSNMIAAVRGDAGHLFATIETENPFAAGSRARLLTELARVHEALAAGDDGWSI
jgi:prephenate dehydrogenase